MAIYYIFNLIINSFLSFFTTFLFMAFFLFAFRIKHPRIKAICYTLPFIKLIGDAFLYDFSTWALLAGQNPNLAEKGTRFLSATLGIGPYPRSHLQFSLGELGSGSTYSIADMLALKMDFLWLKVICFSFILISLVRLTHFFLRWQEERKHLVALLERASRYLSKQGTFFTSSEVSSPCVILGKVILPSSLKDVLSKEERGAVLAHESEHIRWKDGFLKLIITVLSALFWWVPTGFLQRKVEKMQELAADLAIYRFGISKFSLAEATLKVAKHKEPVSGLSFMPFTGRGALADRMNKILKGKPPLMTASKWILTLILGWFSLACLLGKFWVF